MRDLPAESLAISLASCRFWSIYPNLLYIAGLQYRCDLKKLPEYISFFRGEFGDNNSIGLVNPLRNAVCSYAPDSSNLIQLEYTTIKAKDIELTSTFQSHYQNSN